MRHHRHRVRGPSTGVAGIVRRMTDALEHRGPDGEGYLRARIGGLRAPAPVDHRPQRGRRPADDHRRRHPHADLQRRDVQLPGVESGARGARASLPLAHRLRGRPRGVRGMGAGRGRAPERDVRVRGARSRSPPGRARARPLRRQAALLRVPRRIAAVRLRDQGIAAPSGLPRRARRGRPPRILHLPELPGRPHALPRDPDPSRRLHADGRSRRADRREHPEVLGLQVRGARAAVGRRRGVRARARPALPAGGRPPARERRAGGLVPEWGHGHRRASPRWRAQQMPGMRTFTIGFDLSSASGLELAFRRARRRPSGSRTCSAPSSTRWC